ncbi:MAG: hypothetical protein ABEJ56_06005 [Candidatus Nanohaloarchaea archaeon]
MSGNEELKEEFKQEVYNYLIVYTLLPWNRMDIGDKYFDRITSKIDDVKVEEDQDMPVYKILLSSSSNTSTIRKELSIVGKERLFFP